MGSDGHLSRLAQSHKPIHAFLRALFLNFETKAFLRNRREKISINFRITHWNNLPGELYSGSCDCI